jgi:hypothetical protein
MWQEVGMAALVGLSLSDAWLCLFMGASLATADRRMSWGFLMGRTMGVVGLLIALGLVGGHLLGSKVALTWLFAGSTIAVAAVLALSRYRPSILGGCATGDHVACDGGEPDGTSGVHGCSEGCAGCAAAEDGEAIEEVGCKHVPKGLLDRMSGRSPMAAGLAVGGFRGAMPCLKVLIITPLLVASPPGTVILMAAAFALTSMVYPLMGILGGRTLSGFLDRGRQLRIAGAVGVAAVGGFTLWRLYQEACAVG